MVDSEASSDASSTSMRAEPARADDETRRRAERSDLKELAHAPSVLTKSAH